MGSPCILYAGREQILQRIKRVGSGVFLFHTGKYALCFR
jgi:hypothetical protein